MIRIKSFKWDRIGSSSMPYEARGNLFEADVLAKKHGWTILGLESKNHILNLERNGVKMNIFLITFMIQTDMNHPKLGKSQLNRKRLNKREREQIFINPRVHTNKGYYKK